MTEEKKENEQWNEFLKEHEELLKKYDYQIIAQPFIAPDGRVLARPVVGPKPKESPIVTP